MDRRIAIWNTLHDGEITVAAREGEALLILVNIPYLRGRLIPLGDTFMLRLFRLRSLEFSNYDGQNKKTSPPSEFSMKEIGILWTHSTEMPVKIATTKGLLTLDFDDLEIRLDTGQVVDYETVYAACRSYWDEWEFNAKRLGETRNRPPEPPHAQPPTGPEPCQP